MCLRVAHLTVDTDLVRWAQLVVKQATCSQRNTKKTAGGLAG